MELPFTKMEKIMGEANVRELHFSMLGLRYSFHILVRYQIDSWIHKFAFMDMWKAVIS